MKDNPIRAETVSSPAVAANNITADTPELAPLLDTHPALLIYTESNPHFEDVRTVFNHEVTATPRAIIRPRNEAELASSVSVCAKNSLPMSVRSGGHDVHGRSLIQDGVVIDVRAFTNVSIVRDNATPYAVVGSGVRSGDLLRILDAEGLVTPVGWCAVVGYTGWAAGGGYGMLTGHYGMGADQILGGRVVAPSGTIVDTDDDPELLWALRGAGLGNFGVIVELRTKVYPRPRLLAGFLAYPYAEVRTVLGNFEKICAEDLPTAFSGEIAVGDLGAGVAVMVHYHWVLQDNEEEGQKHLQKMRELGTLVYDSVKETMPHEFDQSMAPLYDSHRHMVVHSVAIDSFSPEVNDILDKYPPPGTGHIAIHHAHGRALTPNPQSAFAMRKRHLIVCMQGTVLLDHDPASKEEAFKWAADLNRAFRDGGVALDQGYWSFTAPEFCEALKFFGEEGTVRLRGLKERYNPRDAFPQAYPVLPASEGGLGGASAV